MPYLTNICARAVLHVCTKDSGAAFTLLLCAVCCLRMERYVPIRSCDTLINVAPTLSNDEKWWLNLGPFSDFTYNNDAFHAMSTESHNPAIEQLHKLKNGAKT